MWSEVILLNLQCSGGRYENRSKTRGSIKGGLFLDQLIDQ